MAKWEKEPQMSVSPWWAPDRHADRRPVLVARGRIKAAVRAHFEAQGFTEVECGALAVSPGNEAHLSAFATEAVGLDGARRTLYLHTSPEFAAKGNDVRTMGDSDIREAANTSNRLLQVPVRALSEGGLSSGSKVGTTLVELRRTVEDLDPKGASGGKGS